MTCEAKQYSDTMVCKCGNRWDTNDYPVPQCNLAQPVGDAELVDALEEINAVEDDGLGYYGYVLKIKTIVQSALKKHRNTQPQVLSQGVHPDVPLKLLYKLGEFIAAHEHDEDMDTTDKLYSEMRNLYQDYIHADYTRACEKLTPPSQGDVHPLIYKSQAQGALSMLLKVQRECVALRVAGKALLDACYSADVRGELDAAIGGELMDALANAITPPSEGVS